MFFNKKERSLENRIAELERQHVIMYQTLDSLIDAWIEVSTDIDYLDSEIKLLDIEFILHNHSKYHVIKNDSGRFLPEKLALTPEKEFILMKVKNKVSEHLKRRDDLSPPTH